MKQTFKLNKKIVEKKKENLDLKYYFISNIIY